jgi:hypothetical protein
MREEHIIPVDKLVEHCVKTKRSQVKARSASFATLKNKQSEENTSCGSFIRDVKRAPRSQDKSWSGSFATLETRGLKTEFGAGRSIVT